ncbi:MAG: Rne/Rng family ribonuclease [Verrucomicrobia bacterium]|nr:Rne/Rng family ribonuclease [Verrucomicrobiota bacterium]
MRFKPTAGIGAKNKKSVRAAAVARAEVLGNPTADEEPVYDSSKHAREIQRAENKAAGLPPDLSEEALKAKIEAEEAEKAEISEKSDDSKEKGKSRSSGRREGNRRGPRERRGENKDKERDKDKVYEPVEIPEQAPKGIVGAIKAAADKVISRVKRVFIPLNRQHKELIINVEPLESRVAVLEDGVLEEFTIERNNEHRLVGSIYKGVVKNLEDGLKAAFVDIGFEKNAFLHYWDIVPNNFDNNIEVVERKKGKGRKQRPKITQKDIPRLYPIGTEIIVQVTKGPIGTKGPRITTNLAIPGRFLVLLPNSDQCGISRKIDNTQERQRLKQIVRDLTVPEGMGVIIRTAGHGQKARYFVRDLAYLVEEWKRIQALITNKKPPHCVFQEPDLIERTVRDFLTEDVERIVVDSKKENKHIQETISRISKRSTNKVKLYQDTHPIFDRFGITSQLHNTFTRQVHLKSGGYIVIDETEALIAIDVNTGRHKSSQKEKDSTILKVNLEAAAEITRQMRLRNIGGLIILDFIDMKSRRDQQSVYQKVKDGLRRDKAKTHVLPISQLGLLEMTRQRQTESMRASVHDDCPYCSGKGQVKSVLTMSVEIQRKLGEILKKRQRDESDYQLMIVVNPKVFHRLRTEDEKLVIQMEKQYFGKMSFRPDPSYHYEEFRIVDLGTQKELARSES